MPSMLQFSLPLDRRIAAGASPRLDHQPVAGFVQPRDHHLRDVDYEPVSITARVDLVRDSGDLRLALPSRSVVRRRIGCWTVNRNSAIAAQVQGFDSTRHRPKAQLTIAELDFGSADPRRTAAAQGGHRQMLPCGHELLDSQREPRLGSLELSPRCHDLRRYLDHMSRAVEELNRRMLRAPDAIDRAYAQPLDIHNLAEIAFVSEAHFIRTFRSTFGETPHRYLQRRRVARAVFQLRHTQRSSPDLCFDVRCHRLSTVILTSLY